jgi:hypothetical protein
LKLAASGTGGPWGTVLGLFHFSAWPTGGGGGAAMTVRGEDEAWQ